MNTAWHFPVMIFASLLVFFLVIRAVLPGQEFLQKKYTVLLLSVWVVIVGMLFGKYGASWGLSWWVYYPIPMLMTVLLPPFVLKLRKTKTFLYLVLSFLSAPVIHLFFSFFFGWTEYMPFWKVSSMQILFF
ncbi:hypothetical protein C8N40_10128 [Pontibacter mucosus]|uniref:Uncharacterized protein n=1 Tax=Pontibacter mucosus TaxID=1649266 RepID=A0A2T5YSE0_9BACT|nr:hypothetical protein [Pontibacter mucosus]PTX22206.1 hypothetical protein C8N40_10128 [Pontibacter mucosus]